METVAINIKNKVKQIVLKHDPFAEIVLFGSRARGDWEEESDWDFLILTDRVDIKELNEQIRNDIWSKIEMVTFDMVQTIVRNRKVWEEDLCFTPLFESISEEGIVI